MPKPQEYIARRWKAGDPLPKYSDKIMLTPIVQAETGFIITPRSARYLDNLVWFRVGLRKFTNTATAVKYFNNLLDEGAEAARQFELSPASLKNIKRAPGDRPRKKAAAKKKRAA